MTYLKKKANCPSLPPATPIVTNKRILVDNARGIFPEAGYSDCYKVVIFLPAQVEETEFYPGRHSIMIVNPGQPLEPKTSPSCLYDPLFIDSGLINSVAQAMGGEGSVLFNNVVSDLPREVLNSTRMYFQETSTSMPGKNLTVSSLEIMLAVALLRYLPNNQQLCSDSSIYDKHSIERVKNYMYEHFQDNISLEELAQVANYSTYHFIRLFKGVTGKTPYDYFIDAKIEKAAEMLQSKILSVTEVSYVCGFCNPSHFATVFKRKKGITPSKFQKYS